MMEISSAELRYSARGMNSFRLNALENFSGDSLLDVGCGNGAYVLRYKDSKKVFGLDYKEFPSWSSDRHLFQIGDAADLSSFSDNSWETISCFETLEHLSDPKKALSEYFRVSSKNLILSVPNCEVPEELLKANLIYSHWNDPTHRQFFDKNSLIKAVEEVGFKIRVVELINPVRFSALLDKHLSSHVIEKWMKMYLLRKLERQYFITLLLVAEKV